MSLKLIGPTTFRSFRCVWMLEELRVPYEHVLAKPWSETAKQYNPQGKIPILVVDDGDFVLSESAAINTYLATKYPSSNLVPTTSSLEQLARYHQLTLTIMTDMDALGLWIYDKHQVLHEHFGKSPEAVREAKRQFDTVQAVLVSQLMEKDHGGPYLLGSDFSAVDILYVHCLDWAKRIGWLIRPDENEEDALGVYLQKCHSRPAYQRTLAKRQAEEEAEKERKQQENSKL